MDLFDIETPCYVCDEARLTRNLELLADVQRRAGCTILLALKAFATFSTFPLMRRYLAGTAASSLYEARLGREEFGGQVDGLLGESGIGVVRHGGSKSAWRPGRIPPPAFVTYLPQDRPPREHGNH